MSSLHELPEPKAHDSADDRFSASEPPAAVISTAHDTSTEPVAPKEEPVHRPRDGEGDVTALKAPEGSKEEVGLGIMELPKAQSGSEVADGETVTGTGEGTADSSKETMEGISESTAALSLEIPPAPLNPSPITETDAPGSDPPPLPPKDEKFQGSAGKQPRVEVDELEIDPEKEAVKNSDASDGGNDVPTTPDEGAFDDQQSEIASIMEQFDDGMGGPGEAEIMSPRLEIGQPMFGSPTHPPRKSSLEPLRSGTPDSLRGSQTLKSPPPRSSSLVPASPVASLKNQNSFQDPNEVTAAPLTPVTSKHLPHPPQPDPEPDLPFDFHRFLEQLRHRTADPVAKFLRSFLLEFAKKQWMVHEQVKIISDFLEFITKKMAQCEVWRTVSDAEFDNAREGMEKLVMNRLYTQTFSPAIPPPEPSLSLKGKRRVGGPSSTPKSGRRGQHQEDVERDEVLAQKVQIYGWVKEEHLDIPPIGEKGRKFMSLAQQGRKFLAHGEYLAY
jgi:hypothetical protein